MPAPAPARRADDVQVVVAVLVPPVAWALSLVLSYGLDDFTCRAVTSTGLTDFLTRVSPTALVVNALLLLLCAAAGVVGWRQARHHRGVHHFLGWLAVLLALSFGLGIIMIAINLFILEPC